MTEQETKWSSYGFRILLNTVSHPFEYAKVLIQIGYEPIPPRPTTTFFGKPALKLPNIFEYVKHVKSVDGFRGCYRGLESKICGNLLSVIVAQKVTDYLETTQENEEESENAVVERKRKFLKTIKNDIITRATTIIVSQPFHVITIRIMAQFIGREVKYQGIFGSIGEIYKQNGILGFFSGLIPRLIGDILTVIIANTLTYVINAYVVEEKELQVFTSSTMMFLATSVTYPFQVVSNCMSVTNSGLKAGSTPFMPHYSDWMNCWNDLSSRNQLKRGSSLIVRYYVPPPTYIGGTKFSSNSKMSYY